MYKIKHTLLCLLLKDFATGPERPSKNLISFLQATSCATMEIANTLLPLEDSSRS